MFELEDVKLASCCGIHLTSVPLWCKLWRSSFWYDKIILLCVLNIRVNTLHLSGILIKSFKFNFSKFHYKARSCRHVEKTSVGVTFYDRFWKIWQSVILFIAFQASIGSSKTLNQLPDILMPPNILPPFIQIADKNNFLRFQLFVTFVLRKNLKNQPKLRLVTPEKTYVET